jgi:glycosyltransferase 2 family protein
MAFAAGAPGVSRLAGWRPVLGAALVLAAAVFLGLTIARHWRELEDFHWQVRALPLGTSVVALAGALAYGVFVWKLVLDRFDHPPVRLSALLRIWFLSNLVRYVPGKIWQFVGAAELARMAGLSRSVVLTSMVVQMGFTLLAALLVSGLVLLPTGLPDGVPVAGLVGLGALALALVHPALLNRALALVARVFRKSVLGWRGRWRDGVLLLGLSVVGWILYGAAFALFVFSVVGTGLESVLPLAGVNALSFLVGYLVFLPPAGLGAREGAMALLLRPYAPVAVAAVLAVLARLWTVAAELLAAGLVVALTRSAPPPGR